MKNWMNFLTKTEKANPIFSGGEKKYFFIKRIV
jgi:hypothetical protein